MITAIHIDRETIADFCGRWKIRQLSLFGSVLRRDFAADSDVDVLIQFADDVHWSLLDHMRMEEELGRIFDRKIDLVSSAGLMRSRNWIRREAILKSAEPIYAA